MKKSFITVVILLAAAFIQYGSYSSADTYGFSGECNCKASAYLTDPDKNGTNVRNQPNGKIVNKLPLDESKGYESGVYIHMKKSKNNWIQIDYITGHSGDTVTKYHDTWVYGGMIGTSTANYNKQVINLYSLPSKKSKITGKINEDQTVSIIGCCGEWVYVIGKGKDGKKVTGWLEPEMQCPNAVTNCC